MPSHTPAIYVQRDPQGRIVTLTRQALSPEAISSQGWEAVAGTEPDVMAFIRELADQDNPLNSTDASVARVTEDLIDILINRGIIQFTDLPQAAQAKLLERRQTRASWADRLHLLLGEDGDHGLI